MYKVDFNENWQMTVMESEGGEKTGPIGVTLPHDASIAAKRDAEYRSGSSGGFFPGAACSYEKTWFAPSFIETLFLCIEGAQGTSRVYLNDMLLREHVNGYTEYYVDLLPAIKWNEENHIRIVTDNLAMPNSRWYTGTGLYRQVWLCTAGEVYLHPWDVFVRATDISEEKALIKAEIRLHGKGNKIPAGKSWRISVSISKSESDTEVAASNRILTEMELTGDKILEELYLERPILWDIDNPYLYKLVIRLFMENELWDEETAEFGVRSIEADRDRGLLVNGRCVKLKGGCIHHDNGPLGAVSHIEIEERRIKRLKESGYNAVRTAHNPASPALLQVCDRLGMFVMEEAFDCWRLPKVSYDYHQFFDKHWEEDLEAMIKRDRNHPSIIMWSTGNEIGERDGSGGGNELSAKLAGKIRGWDDTRLVTNGVCAVFEENGKFGGLLGNIFNGSAGELEDIAIEYPGALETYRSLMERFPKLTLEFCAPLDIVGYNYLESRYEQDAADFPGRIFCGTESYPSAMKENWDKVESMPFVIGDFTWTAFDYLGEAGIGRSVYGLDKLPGLFGEYPWHIAGCGDFDICGYLKPQGEYRRRLWKTDITPYIAVLRPELYNQKEIISPWGWPDVKNSWSFPGEEGATARVDVYTRAENAELYLNGIKTGKRIPSKLPLCLSFEVPYEPGVLEAVTGKAEDGAQAGMHPENKAVQRSYLRTAGRPCRLKLIPEEDRQMNSKYIFISCEIQDNNGSRVLYARNRISVKCSGEGYMVKALGTSDGISEEAYAGDSRCALEGRILIILERTGTAGCELQAVCEGLEEDCLSLI